MASRDIVLRGLAGLAWRLVKLKLEVFHAAFYGFQFRTVLRHLHVFPRKQGAP